MRSLAFGGAWRGPAPPDNLPFVRLHRFIGDFELSQEHLIVIDAELAGQLSRVLRLKKGDTVILCDGKGREATAEISSLREKSVAFKITDSRQAISEPQREVTLYCSILKRENFELVAQKATELGVRTIVPLLCARTVKHDINPNRVVKIMKEASEQSGRGTVPVLLLPLSFPDALAEARGYDATYFFDTNGTRDLSVPTSSRRIAAFVGPEGGWDENERTTARDAGFSVISLSTLTLRAETAAIVAVFALR